MDWRDAILDTAKEVIGIAKHTPVSPPKHVNERTELRERLRSYESKYRAIINEGRNHQKKLKQQNGTFMGDAEMRVALKAHNKWERFRTWQNMKERLTRMIKQAKNSAEINDLRYLTNTHWNKRFHAGLKRVEQKVTGKAYRKVDRICKDDDSTAGQEGEEEDTAMSLHGQRQGDGQRGE